VKVNCFEGEILNKLFLEEVRSNIGLSSWRALEKQEGPLYKEAMQAVYLTNTTLVMPLSP
jgi:hypothetical protein